MLSPAMTKPLHAPSGIVAMDAFHDRREHYLLSARREVERAATQVACAANMHGKCYTDEELEYFSMYASEHAFWTCESVSIYVIGSRNPTYVKIGQTNNPVKRLAALQVGNPIKLHIHRLFVYKNANLATGVEFSCHKLAGKKHRRLMGEWFKCTAPEAHSVIHDVANGRSRAYRLVMPGAMFEYEDRHEDC